jgi:predicted double-glycine peptidase
MPPNLQVHTQAGRLMDGRKMLKPMFRQFRHCRGNPVARRHLAYTIMMMLALAGCAAPPRLAGDFREPDKFRTWQELQFANVVRQQTDFTCGAAALSILSKYFIGHDIEESEIAEAIKASYSEEEWERREGNGLTLLDIKQAAEKFGLRAEGMKLTMDAMLKLRGPVIVHLDKGELMHFSVLRGTSGDRVYLADPITGNMRMPMFRFAEQWTGYALMVWDPDHPLLTDYPLQLSMKDSGTEVLGARRSLYITPYPANNVVPPP